MTSGGRPASSRISTRRWAVWGTSSEGLSTTAFPQSSAGNIFQVGIAMGKLKGVNRPRHADGSPVAHGPLAAELARHRPAKQATALRGGIVRRIDAFLYVTSGFIEDFAHLTGHRAGQ